MLTKLFLTSTLDMELFIVALDELERAVTARKWTCWVVKALSGCRARSFHQSRGIWYVALPEPSSWMPVEPLVQLLKVAWVIRLAAGWLLSQEPGIPRPPVRPPVPPRCT